MFLRGSIISDMSIATKSRAHITNDYDCLRAMGLVMHSGKTLIDDTIWTIGF